MTIADIGGPEIKTRHQNAQAKGSRFYLADGYGIFFGVSAIGGSLCVVPVTSGNNTDYIIRRPIAKDELRSFFHKYKIDYDEPICLGTKHDPHETWAEQSVPHDTRHTVSTLHTVTPQPLAPCSIVMPGRVAPGVGSSAQVLMGRYVLDCVGRCPWFWLGVQSEGVFSERTSVDRRERCSCGELLACPCRF